MLHSSQPERRNTMSSSPPPPYSSKSPAHRPALVAPVPSHTAPSSPKSLAHRLASAGPSFTANPPSTPMPHHSHRPYMQELSERSCPSGFSLALLLRRAGHRQLVVDLWPSRQCPTLRLSRAKARLCSWRTRRCA
jgi:hypothetical protein